MKEELKWVKKKKTVLAQFLVNSTVKLLANRSADLHNLKTFPHADLCEHTTLCCGICLDLLKIYHLFIIHSRGSGDFRVCRE